MLRVWSERGLLSEMNGVLVLDEYENIINIGEKNEYSSYFCRGMWFKNE